MKLILLIAAYFLIPIAAHAWLAHCLSSYKAHESQVSYRPYVLIIGIADVVAFLAIATAATIMDQFSWFVVLGCFFFVALGVFAIVVYCNCRIRFDETSFTVTDFWGKERTYTYNEITGIRDDGYATNILYCGKRRVEVAYIASGSREFMAMVQTQYKQIHDDADIPKLPRKKDPFNGHIRNPWEVVVAFIAASVLAVGVLVTLAVFLLQPYNETNTTLKECCFTSCGMQEQELLLISDEGERYKMEYVPEEYPVARLRALCDGKTPLKVYVRTVTPEDEKPYYGIEQIETAETVVLSFKESKMYEWEMNGRKAMIGVAGLLVLGWVMMGFSFVVGRNPSKYPRWIVRMFFKERNVIYDE